MPATATSGPEPSATTSTGGNPPANSLPPTSTAPAVPEASLERKIAEMIMIGYNGTTLADMDSTEEALRDGVVGNLVLFDRNVVSPQQLSTFTSEVSGLTASPPLISIDQEGGFVARLRPDKGFPETVTAQFLGTHDLSVTRRYADTIASTLKAAGINLNLAPVVDVNVNPASPAIGFYERSFSADPEAVAEHALEFIRAHHDHGVLSTLKHFAGHGSATTDSHLGITDVTDTWSREELIPFQRIIDAGQADAIMTAHLVNAQLDPDYPGTLSRPTITGMLREEMGFDGVVITDDMQMGAIRQEYGYEHALELAVLAGADMLAIANMLTYDPELPAKTFNAVLSAVQAGTITEERIDESYQRIMRLKSRLA
jgi:beta-N-acetylhexosaminidase